MLYLNYSPFRNLNLKHHILIGVSLILSRHHTACVFNDTDFSGDIFRLLRGHVIPRWSITSVIFTGWTVSLCTVQCA